jgi:UDPglucose--hexose-1-phosphate uridylyltransferase
VAEDKHAIAIAPYASQNPYEVWILPKADRNAFSDLTDDERTSVATMLKRVTMFLDKARISFNFFLQDSLPPFEHHFVLKIEPRQTIWAGLELSTGVIINPVAPETAATWYKKSR